MSTTINGIEAAPIFGASGMATTGKLFFGLASTNANGQWSIVVPAGIFASAPGVFPVPVSSDNTAPNGAYASVVAPTQSGGAWMLSGLVLLPAAIQALGGLPVKAAGAGVVVNVLAVGP